MDLVNQQLGERYRIRHEIGRGATATVYLAHDLKHDRPVALKILDPQLAAAVGNERFLREIAFTARLDHPHILSLLDSGEAEGLLYYVMPYVQGESLRDRLTREKQLPLNDALEIAREVADALSYAHEHGVVHRDIKPENILLAGAHARVADFGIARALTAAQGDSITQAGITVGTPAYMSPEQASGDPADARSDIYSLGCVLYEMLTGQPPYTGATPEALLARKFVEPLPSVRVVRETVPPVVEQALVRAMAKVPADRFASARQFADALKGSLTTAPIPVSSGNGAKARSRLRIAALAGLVVAALALAANVGGLRTQMFGAANPSIESLAVLPLENVSADANQDYLAAGMHEALIINLGKLSGLRRVSARPSVLRYTKTDKSPRQIGAELGVGALMSGTVLRSGDRVRVTAHLIDAATEEPLWSNSYERDISDVLTLQNEIVSAIALQVRLQLSPRERAELTKARRVNPQAYQAYLKGKFQLNTFTPEAFANAMTLFREAVAIDPTEPLAYAALAHAYSIRELFILEPTLEDVPRAKAAALKALELDETLAEAHAALAYFKFCKEWDYPGAERSFRRAMELNANLADPHAYYGWYLQSVGRDEEAVAQMKRAIELDPLSPLFAAWLGGLYWTINRFDEAIVEAKKALELVPDFPVGLFVLGGASADIGRFDEAIAIYKRALQKYPRQNFTWSLAQVYAQAGRPAEARTLMSALESGASVSDAKDPYNIARAYMRLADHEKALDWLEKAYDSRNLFLPAVWRDPAFTPLQENPRFVALVRRLNLPRTKL